MVRKVITLSSLMSVVFLIVLMQLTTPAEVGPLGVLVFFILVYLVSLGLAVWCVKGAYALLGKLKNMGNRDIRYGSIVAFMPVMLMVAQSFGNVSLLEVALVVIFVCLGCFLVSKRL